MESRGYIENATLALEEVRKVTGDLQHVKQQAVLMQEVLATAKSELRDKDVRISHLERDVKVEDTHILTLQTNLQALKAQLDATTARSDAIHKTLAFCKVLNDAHKSMLLAACNETTIDVLR
jgi:hypothetical protein